VLPHFNVGAEAVLACTIRPKNPVRMRPSRLLRLSTTWSETNPFLSRRMGSAKIVTRPTWNKSPERLLTPARQTRGDFSSRVFCWEEPRLPNSGDCDAEIVNAWRVHVWHFFQIADVYVVTLNTVASFRRWNIVHDYTLCAALHISVDTTTRMPECTCPTKFE
jgi:hypothetical protein